MTTVTTEGKAFGTDATVRPILRPLAFGDHHARPERLDDWTDDHGDDRVDIDAALERLFA